MVFESGNDAGAIQHGEAWREPLRRPRTLDEMT